VGDATSLRCSHKIDRSYAIFHQHETNGRVRRGAAAWTVEVTESPDDNISIGTALEVGKTEKDASVWSLRVRGEDVPGLFVVEDGLFVSLGSTPA
jgi:hypothetical protein